MANIENKVENLIEKKITQLGYELYDVEYVKEGKNFFLKIYIDKPEGINVDDCELVNNSITDILDEADYIKEQYFLEISSTGIERILRKDRHLKDNIGKIIEVKLFKPLDGKKSYQGKLENFNSQEIEIFFEDMIIKIDRNNISLIKTIYNWELGGI